MIDIEAARRYIAAKLPLSVRWYVHDTPWDWNFVRVESPLGHLEEKDLNFWPCPSNWRELYLFGEEDYAEGGGASAWVGIEPERGIIYGLDPERDQEAIFLRNSSIERFVSTFVSFDKFLRDPNQYNHEIVTEIRALDQEAYDASDWRLLAEELMQ